MPHRIAAFIALCALVPGLARGGTNLITNPGFDGGIGGWNPYPGFYATLGASPIDELGKPGGGSLRLYDIAPSWSQLILSNCFAVAPGDELVYGVSVFAAGSQSVNASLLLFEDAACSDPVGYSDSSDLSISSNFPGAATWQPVQGHDAVPAGVQSARLAIGLGVPESPPSEVLLDNAFVYEGATCASTSTVVCLNDRRFRVDLRWQIADGTRGYASLLPFSGDSARATFFDPQNVEVVLKVLDGCSLNNRVWVFVAGLTNVAVNLRVTDTQTGVKWTRANPLNTAFAPIQDTSAFADCPN